MAGLYSDSPRQNILENSKRAGCFTPGREKDGKRCGRNAKKTRFPVEQLI